MLQVGDHAPTLTLHDVDGDAFRLEPSPTALTLAIFFKTTCPTCQYAWPYYERLHSAFASAGLRVVGISQHDEKKTRAFRDQYYATFPHLIDQGFTASRVYDPDFVPTGFL